MPLHANTTDHEYKVRGTHQEMLEASLAKELDDLWVNPNLGRQHCQVAAGVGSSRSGGTGGGSIGTGIAVSTGGALLPLGLHLACHLWLQFHDLPTFKKPPSTSGMSHPPDSKSLEDYNRALNSHISTYLTAVDEVYHTVVV